jgi:putative lipoprotein (rSAM/lipoprotein system)
MFPVAGTVEQLVGSARSDIHGRYQLINYDFNSQVDHTYRVKITDVDGALNGSYQSLDTTVVLQNTKFINGDGSWNAGVAETELNIKLKPKK